MTGLILKKRFMKKHQFKTNINCSGCVSKVTPMLNAAPGIKEWSVDTANPLKILTVETESLEPDQVRAMVEKAGFKAEKIEAGRER